MKSINIQTRTLTKAVVLLIALFAAGAGNRPAAAGEDAPAAWTWLMYGTENAGYDVVRGHLGLLWNDWYL